MKIAGQPFRPSLSIYMPPEDDCSQQNQFICSNLVEVKPLNSTKNDFQMHRNFFKQQKDKKSLIRKQSLTREQLQQQKQDLIDSINILKTSAVSALAQKSDQIQQLRQVGLEHSQDYLQLYNDYRSKQELSECYKELEQQYKQQRNQLINTLKQKQTTIEDLQELIDKMKLYITQIQQNQENNIEEIKRLEEQVLSLNEQMEQYTLKNALEDIRTDLDDQKLVMVESTNSHKELGLTSANILQPLEDQNALEQHYQHIISQLQNHHKQELAHLAQFYERKIKIFREQCDTYLRNQLYEDINQFSMDLSANKQELQLEHSLSRSFSEKQHQINLIPIYQQSNVDLTSQYSAHNLQEQISPPNHFKDSENMSQFTKNHFDPLVFCKQKSIPSFEKQYKSHLVRIQNRSTEETYCKEQKDMEVQVGNPEPSPKEELWKKAKTFTSGLVTGVSLTSLVSFAIRKKK